MITIKFKVGKSMVEYQNADLKTIMKFSALLGALPQKCDCCASENVYLSHKSPKGNDYYMIRCKDCYAELNFHQKKEGGTFYLVDGEKMSVYQKEDGQQKAADIVKQDMNGEEDPQF